PEIILAGRRVNDGMGQYVASEVVKMMLKNDIKVNGARVLMLGITFKENCPDVRNTKIVDVIRHLKEYGIDITIYDPWASPEEVQHEYGLNTVTELPNTTFDTIVLGVAHKTFLDLEFSTLLNTKGLIYDVKGVLKKHNKSSKSL